MCVGFCFVLFCFGGGERRMRFIQTYLFSSVISGQLLRITDKSFFLPLWWDYYAAKWNVSHLVYSLGV